MSNTQLVVKANRCGR